MDNTLCLHSAQNHTSLYLPLSSLQGPEVYRCCLSEIASVKTEFSLLNSYMNLFDGFQAKIRQSATHITKVREFNHWKSLAK